MIPENIQGGEPWLSFLNSKNVYLWENTMVSKIFGPIQFAQAFDY